MNDSSTLVTKVIRIDIDDASRAYSFANQVVCDHLNCGDDFFRGPYMTHSWYAHVHLCPSIHGP